MPRVLFLTHPREDYLQDQVLYGLRQLLGADCVDWPRKDVLYRDCPRPKESLYGRGFTLWKQLPEIAVERPASVESLGLDHFDAVIFGSLVRQKGLLRALRPQLRSRRVPPVALLDGRDKERLYWPALGRGQYFKRERTALSRWLTHPISFSIPEHRVAKRVPPKEALFATHVQCEAAYGHPWVREHCRSSYAFEDEKAYRGDLESAHFGITMRKGGFECQRHYEIAAAGAIPCFYHLESKSAHGAPFGLRDGENAIAFRDARELEMKTQAVLERGAQESMAERALDWARDHSCEAVAGRLLETLQIERPRRTRAA